MKQSITKEQSRGLSELAQQKLREYARQHWKPYLTYGSKKIDDNESFIINGKNDHITSFDLLPPYVILPNIGQMIEFLDKNSSCFSIHQPSTQSRYGNKWMLEFLPNKVIAKKELCDALWEVIKEILEK